MLVRRSSQRAKTNEKTNMVFWWDLFLTKTSRKNFVWNPDTSVWHKTTPKHLGALIAGIPWFIVLCFMVLHRHCCFYKLNVCGNPASSKSIGTIFFPAAFAHSVFLCHVLVIFMWFPLFSLLLYLLGWSVITDLWYYCSYSCFGYPQTTLTWEAKLHG